jgi:hypothetical protein
MPVLARRYFFGVRWSDHEDVDPNGTLLSDNEAALDYADFPLPLHRPRAHSPAIVASTQKRGR